MGFNFWTSFFFDNHCFCFSSQHFVNNYHVSYYYISLRLCYVLYCLFQADEIPMNQSSSRSRENDIESGRSIWSETPVGALQEIAMNFGTKVI